MRFTSIEPYNSYFDPNNFPLILCVKRKIIHVENTKIVLDKLPYLINPETGNIYFPTTSAVIINESINNTDSNCIKINVLTKFKKGKFVIAERTQFKYSTVDHFFIPGLIRNIPTNGFLTPVYFDPNLLVMYEYGKRYSLQKYSDSYGIIYLKDGASIKYGINKYGYVVMWLGDLVDLPPDEKLFLYSMNVDSCSEIHSDFYNAEIENQWIE